MWCVVVGYGVARYGMVLCEEMWYDIVWYGMVWCGMVGCGVARYGMALCEEMWYSIVWWGGVGRKLRGLDGI